MHNHDKGNGNSTMWMMMICCVVPVLLIALFGLGGKYLGAPTWVVIGGIGVMIIAHYFMMGRSHKHSGGGKSATDGDCDHKDKNDHSDHGCCH